MRCTWYSSVILQGRKPGTEETGAEAEEASPETEGMKSESDEPQSQDSNKVVVIGADMSRDIADGSCS